jgi:hypothetical protein
MNIVLHIDRLVLDGVTLARGEHEAFREAFAQELSTLLAGGLHPDLLAGGARPEAAGGSIVLDRTAGGAQLGGARLGADLARAVHGGIGRGL